MVEDGLIEYFGANKFTELSQFYKTGVIREFVKKQVSLHNINIALVYLKDVRRGGVEQATLMNNRSFMSWLLYRFKKDLDKLTEQDRSDILDLIDDWIKDNGKPAQKASKHMYKALFKKFLDKYGEKTHNKALKELSNFKISNAKPKTKLPEDILTETEVVKLINNAEGIRNKAMIAVLYESGARIGELEKCKFRHVQEFHRGSEHGYRIIVNGKTGPRQVPIYLFQQWLRTWLEVCNNIDPDTPLFPTTRKYAEDSFSSDEKIRSNSKNQTHDYVPLKSKRVNIILRDAAKKAGIKKNVHAHALRHARATRLANNFSDQQLKVHMGWTSGSNMTAIYCHLSGKDTENALLRSYGIIVEEDENNKVEKCAQCGEVLSPGFRLCPKCGMPLTHEAKESKDKIDALISLFMSNPEAQKTFFENLQVQTRNKTLNSFF